MAGSGKQLSAAQLEHLRQIAHLGGAATAARHGGWAAAHAARNARGTPAKTGAQLLKQQQDAARRAAARKAALAAGTGNAPNRTDISGTVAGATNQTRHIGVQKPSLTAAISKNARVVGGVSGKVTSLSTVGKTNARIIKTFGLPKDTVLVAKSSSLAGSGDPPSKADVAAAKKTAAAEKKAATATAKLVKAVLRATSNAPSRRVSTSSQRVGTPARARATSTVATYLRNLRARSR